MTIKAKDMDLRDAFALAALSDLEGLHHLGEPFALEPDCNHIAQCVYQIAEAMMAYRIANPSPY